MSVKLEQSHGARQSLNGNSRRVRSVTRQYADAENLLPQSVSQDVYGEGGSVRRMELKLSKLATFGPNGATLANRILEQFRRAITRSVIRQPLKELRDASQKVDTHEDYLDVVSDLDNPREREELARAKEKSALLLLAEADALRATEGQ